MGEGDGGVRTGGKGGCPQKNQTGRSRGRTCSADEDAEREEGRA